MTLVCKGLMMILALDWAFVRAKKKWPWLWGGCINGMVVRRRSNVFHKEVIYIWITFCIPLDQSQSQLNNKFKLTSFHHPSSAGTWSQECWGHFEWHMSHQLSPDAALLNSVMTSVLNLNKTWCPTYMWNLTLDSTCNVQLKENCELM